MRTGRRLEPRLETLDTRELLSSLPVNTIGTATGNVPTRSAVAALMTSISQHNLTQRRHSTLFGLAARPLMGSSLNPRIVFAQGASGKKLPFHPGAPYLPRIGHEALAYTKNGQAGALTTGVTGRDGTTGNVQVRTYLPGDVNGDGAVNLDDEVAFAAAYGTRKGQPGYLPSADANQNGQIGQGDARFLLRNLAPLTPKRPLTLDVHLLLADQSPDAAAVDSLGGITRKADVTIVGHTTPGSLVFLDGPNDADYNFEEKVIPTDAKGNFSYHLHLDNALTNTEYLVIDPYGQQLIQALPIRFVMS